MSWPAYKAKYVLHRSAIEKNSPQQNGESIIIGRDFQRRERYAFKYPCTDYERTFMLTNQTDMLDLRKFWRTHKGMLTALWLPSFARDFLLTQGQIAGSAILRVQRTALNLLDGRTRHIYIPRIGFAAKVSGITDMTTYYAMYLDAALSSDINADDVVSTLHYVRFASDQFVLRNYRSGGIWEVTLSFNELPREAPA